MTCDPPDPAIQLTEELNISGPISTDFFHLYMDAFGSLRYTAAARHALSRAEWDEEMSDPRITKIVAWAGDVPVGIALVARDLAAVPWISRDFYTTRYPDRTLYYCGINLVRPAYQGRSVFGLLCRQVMEIARRDGALGGWDCSSFTRDQVALLERMKAVIQGHYSFEPELIDTQSYYVVDPCLAATS